LKDAPARNGFWKESDDAASWMRGVISVIVRFFCFLVLKWNGAGWNGMEWNRIDGRNAIGSYLFILLRTPIFYFELFRYFMLYYVEYSMVYGTKYV
jgi:hypothetical protein